MTKNEKRILELETQLKVITDAAYFEDCHITGEHDPNHTPQSICRFQLSDLARRVTTALFGVEWLDNGLTRPEELNKIPRKINKRGWYKYFKEHPECKSKADAIDRWEKRGYKKL